MGFVATMRPSTLRFSAGFNIRSLILHSPSEWATIPVRRADSFLLAQMVFDSANDLDAALRLRHGRRRATTLAVPAIRRDVTHEAMAGKVIF